MGQLRTVVYIDGKIVFDETEDFKPILQENVLYKDTVFLYNHRIVFKQYTINPEATGEYDNEL